MSKKPASSIVFLNPNEYFNGVINGGLTSLRFKISPHAQTYLVSLLSHFISQDNLFPQDAEGRHMETLTEQLAHALGEEARTARLQRLKHLGDFSLYVSGFFSCSLKRKLVDVDYYIGMGEAAYQNAANLEKKDLPAQIFLELSRKFPQLVDLLAEISEECGAGNRSEEDLLRIYDLWEKTGSERLAKKLTQAGISTVPRKTGTDDGDS